MLNDPLNPSLDSICLNDNKRILLSDNRQDEILETYILSQSQNQKFILTLKKWMGKPSIELRKWKRDIWYGTDDYYPSNKGIVFDLRYNLTNLKQAIDDIDNRYSMLKIDK